jgi:membrane glycosyltransferase
MKGNKLFYIVSFMLITFASLYYFVVSIVFATLVAGFLILLLIKKRGWANYGKTEL